jgi:peptide/nickel transport system permease protein
MSGLSAISDSATADVAAIVASARMRGYWGNVWQRLRYDYVTLLFLAVIILIVLSAVFAPLLSPFDPNKASMAHRLKPLFFHNNYLGTDEQGRDMLSRLLYGGRTSLLMGILPVFAATIIGGLFGVVAGYAGGRLGMVIMRTMDVFFAFPSVLLAVAISGSLGGGMVNQLVTLTVVLTPPICRVAETATSQIRGMGSHGSRGEPHRVLPSHRRHAPRSPRTSRRITMDR